ncbi:MAG: hypothetical protein K2P94_06550 [Rhodospirillaceae bacterium]|nr:hypothetical protein [Rhodospirillaceae bacterium]
MLPVHIRLFVLASALLLACCDATDRPTVCRADADARAMKEAEAYVKQAEEAVVRARMMGPSPHVQNVRPPEFEPDPVAAGASAKLRHARFKLAQAMAACRDGSR